jgi:hypothetical protein
LREYNPAREAEVALMALSMDEQRVLAEIERRLSAEDPRLAACMSSFRRPGPSVALRSPRARILGSLFTVALVAIISLMVYAIIPFRGAHSTRTPGGGSGSVPVSSAEFRPSGAKSAGTHATAATASGVTKHAKTPATSKAAKSKS